MFSLVIWRARNKNIVKYKSEQILSLPLKRSGSVMPLETILPNDAVSPTPLRQIHASSASSFHVRIAPNRVALGIFQIHQTQRALLIQPQVVSRS